MELVADIVWAILYFWAGLLWAVTGVSLAILAPRNGPRVAAYLHSKIDELSARREEWVRKNGV